MFDTPCKFSVRAFAGVFVVAVALCAQAQTAPSGPAAAATDAAPAADAVAATADTVAVETAQTSTAPNRQGTFKTVHGEVTVVHGNMRSAAVVGGPLRASDRVMTGAQGAAAISLLDGTVIELGANSTVDLAQFRFDSTTDEGSMLVKLTHGTLRMITGLIAKTQPEQVKVATPTAVIGVRGTDFIVEAQ